MKYLLALLLFCSPVIAGASVMPNPVGSTNKVRLKKRTPVSLRLIESINTIDPTTQEGTIVALEVVLNVVTENETVITTNAYAEGKISSFKKRRSFGRGASISIKAINAQAVDGQRVILKGEELKTQREGKQGVAWGLFIGFALISILLAALINGPSAIPIILIGAGLGLALGGATKGLDVEIPANQILSATVAEDIYIYIEP